MPYIVYDGNPLGQGTKDKALFKKKIYDKLNFGMKLDILVLKKMKKFHVD